MREKKESYKKLKKNPEKEKPITITRQTVIEKIQKLEALKKAMLGDRTTDKTFNEIKSPDYDES